MEDPDGKLVRCRSVDRCRCVGASVGGEHRVDSVGASVSQAASLQIIIN